MWGPFIYDWRMWWPHNVYNWFDKCVCFIVGRKMYYLTWVLQFFTLLLGNMGFILLGGRALKVCMLETTYVYCLQGLIWVQRQLHYHAVQRSAPTSMKPAHFIVRKLSLFVFFSCWYIKISFVSKHIIRERSIVSIIPCIIVFLDHPFQFLNKSLSKSNLEIQ